MAFYDFSRQYFKKSTEHKIVILDFYNMRTEAQLLTDSAIHLSQHGNCDSIKTYLLNC